MRGPARPVGLRRHQVDKKWYSHKATDGRDGRRRYRGFILITRAGQDWRG
jgi:hypothetical protein